MQVVIYAMIYLGSALMIYNIISYIRYARYIQELEDWGKERRVLQIPIFLLIMFFAGYMAVGIFGKPDLIVSGILFGGSIFVFIIFSLLKRITNRIVENERREAELMAVRESHKAKFSFLSSVSHEMRTPMNAIIGLDYISLNNLDLPGETRQQLEKIGLSARHMLGLINNILDMSQAESGEITFNRDRFSMKDILSLEEILVQDKCSQKGLVFEADISSEINDHYTGDGAKIRQVLANVLDNAVKFSDAPGKVTFTAELKEKTDTSHTVSFTVRDEGEGISEGFLPHVYDTFAVEDTTSTQKQGGSGMGLAIAKKYTDLMNGQISVSSKKGSGTTVVITIPLEVCGWQEDFMQDAELNVKEQGTSLEGKRVLIAEDIDLNAELLADLLEMEGVISERAENGQIAVDMFSGNPEYYYDAVFMDLRMPVMDGLDATKAIRAMDRPDAADIPILALTANAFDKDIQKSLDAGMNVHMAKPVDADTLIETLRNEISRSRSKHI